QTSALPISFEARTRVRQTAGLLAGLLALPRRCLLEFVRHRPRGLRQPAVGDRSRTEADRIDGRRVALAEFSIEGTWDLHRTRERTIPSVAVANARVDLATDLDTGSVELQRVKRAFVVSALDGRGQLRELDRK